MGQNAVKVLKITISNSPKNKILEEIQKYLAREPRKSQKPLKIFTPNTEQLVFANKNPGFTSILNQADISIPDAIGVIWASRFLTNNGPKTNIPGVEFMGNLVELAENRHVTIGLIGGRDNLAVDTLNCLRQNTKTLTGWAEDGPDIDVNKSDFTVRNEDEKIYFSRIIRHIIRENTQIIFVAFGPPKQEWFILRIAQELMSSDNRLPIVLMAVGGSFDIISGRLPRAPLWMRSIGLEWFWRLILEPRRIIRQFALIEFMWLVLREKLFSRSS